MTRLYVAYGSNLHMEQMAYRCPTAEVYGSGVLQGYQLTFQGDDGASYANIQPKTGKQVPVLVWDIQPSDEKSLDRYEGFPHMYEKQTVLVRLDSGRVVEAMAYVMTDERPHYGIPSVRYYRCVEQGYKDAGFDLRVLVSALEMAMDGGLAKCSSGGW